MYVGVFDSCFQETASTGCKVAFRRWLLQDLKRT